MISVKTLRLLFFSLFASASTLVSTNAFAEWTLNLGYHNPVNSKLGLNFLYWGSQWNFEIGVGWVDADIHADDDKEENGEKNDDKASAAVAGDLDLKYRFSTGTFSPYIQGGYGAWTAAQVGDESGAHADIGGPFVGLGFFIGKPSFHVYVAGNYLLDPEDVQVQGGFGFAL